MKPEGNGHTILVGEDAPEVRGYLEMSLKCLGYSVEFAQDGDEVLSTLQSLRSSIDVVLLDVIMPNREGLDALREIHAMEPDLPVIIVTGGGYSPADVMNAMKCGATDFLCKPVAHEELKRAIEKALEGRASRGSNASEPSSVKRTSFTGISPRMVEVQAFVKRVGWCEAPVLIQGETGSGKEVFARDLHAQSPRAHKPFLKLNCAAVPSELLESELFGYEKGAFTGAFQKKAGLFEVANGGSLLLDEIGDMEIRLQAKLLQVLQDQEFQRIGGKETIRVDVRILSATHQDLERAIVEKRFREDLYYRLQVINMVIPSLRERQEDILPLAEFLWRRHGGPGPLQMTPDLKHVFMTYRWPGNVRELENTVRKLMVLRDPELIAKDLQSRAARLELSVMPKSNGAGAVAPVKVQPIGPPVLEQVTKANQQAESEAILDALNASRWNRKQAAKLLKIDYKALLYKMKKLGLDEQRLPIYSEGLPDQARAAMGGAD